MSVFNYTPTPTGLAFHNSRSFIRAKAGPPGSAKSVTCATDGLFMAMRQTPDNQGRRRFRLGVIRSTYPKLRSTTVATVNDWMPSECGSIKQTAPMTGLYVIPLPDGTTVHYELIFIALENEADIDALKSLELSQIWINEAAEVDEAIAQICISRVGRFPSPKDGAPCDFPGMMLDFNLVDTDHWLHKWCVTEKPDNLEYFEQPPAFFCENYEDVVVDNAVPVYHTNPAAENLRNLPRDYYQNMLKAFKWNQIQAFLLMKWVSSGRGKLVYGRDFSYLAHVGKIRTKPVLTETVLIGIDTSGLHPAAVFGQMQAGTLVIMDECYGEDMAFEQFIQDVLVPLIAARYQGVALMATCDPSNPRDARTGVTPVQLLKQYRIPAQPASTNTFSLRREAVSKLLNKRNGVVIDPACKMLIKGFSEGYVFKKMRGTTTGSGQIYSSQPEKNEFSHFHDACQYLALPLARVVDELPMSGAVQRRLVKRRVV